MNKEIEKLLSLIQDTMFLQKQKRILVSNIEAEARIHQVELMKIEKTLQDQYRELNKKLKETTND